MYKITIEGVANGWIAKVGCMTFVSEDKDKMLSELGRYIDNPVEVEKEYTAKLKNQNLNQPVVVNQAIPAEYDAQGELIHGADPR